MLAWDFCHFIILSQWYDVPKRYFVLVYSLTEYMYMVSKSEFIIQTFNHIQKHLFTQPILTLTSRPTLNHTQPFKPHSSKLTRSLNLHSPIQITLN